MVAARELRGSDISSHNLTVTCEYHRHDSQCQEHRKRLNPADSFPEIGLEGGGKPASETHLLGAGSASLLGQREDIAGGVVRRKHFSRERLAMVG